MILTDTGGLNLGTSTPLGLGANNLTLTGSIGATGARATKVWATDIESTNAPTVGGTAVLVSGGALGTPSSGTATNLTGTATGLTVGITNGLKSATTTVDVSAATAPSSGQVLTATSSTTATWQTPAGGGGWALVYNGTFSGATTATIDNNGTNLAGNTDEIYMIVIRAVQSTADRLLLRFNNATTNYLSNLTGHNQAGTDTDSSGAADSGVRVTPTVTGGKQHFITATCYTKTTPIKMMVFNAVSTDGSNITNSSGGGHWNDTSTAVTSFTIASSGGVNFDSGSEYWLYKKS